MYVVTLSSSYLRLVFAAFALVAPSTQIGDGDQAADVAHMHAVRVGHLEESLAQELGGAVCDLRVALHLAEAQTAVSEGMSMPTTYLTNRSD